MGTIFKLCSGFYPLFSDPCLPSWFLVSTTTLPSLGAWHITSRAWSSELICFYSLFWPFESKTCLEKFLCINYSFNNLPSLIFFNLLFSGTFRSWSFDWVSNLAVLFCKCCFGLEGRFFSTLFSSFYNLHPIYKWHPIVLLQVFFASEGSFL